MSLFYRAELIYNPSGWDRLLDRFRGAVIRFFQKRGEKARAKYAFGA